MNPGIKAFFESYRDAFNAFDPKAIAGHYSIPSGIVSIQGYVHLNSFGAIHKNMISLCDQYRKKGYLQSNFEPMAIIDQGPDFTVVDLKWIIERSGRLEPLMFRTTYNLRKETDGWRVLLATAYEE